MPPENGRQEVTLFLSIAACELFKAFNGLQLAQAEEANYKTLREKSEEPSTLEQICNLGRNDEVLPLFPGIRKDKEEQQNGGKMMICCKDGQVLSPLTPQGHRNHSIALITLDHRDRRNILWG